MQTGIAFLAAVAAVPLAAAAPTDQGGTGLYGLSAGNPSSFSTSPNGCAISLLFDHLTLRWSNGVPSPAHPSEAYFELVATRGARGKAIKLDIRGSALGRADAPRIRIVAGGQTLAVRPKGESFLLTVRAKLNADRMTTPVRVVLDLPRPARADESASLQVDSIDLSIPGCGKGQAS